MFLNCNLSTYNLKNLKVEFDVILVEPPLEEYQHMLPVTRTNYWNWKQVGFSIFIIVLWNFIFVNFLIIITILNQCSNNFLNLIIISKLPSRFLQ